MNLLARKIITTFTLVSMLIIGYTLSVSAEEQVYTEGYFKYQREDNSIIICEYFGSAEEVTVPAMIVGDPVSTIASGAFSHNKSVKKINLPDTIMFIEENAFGIGQTVVYNSNTDHPQVSGGSTTNPEDEESTTNPGNGESQGSSTNPSNPSKDGNTGQSQGGQTGDNQNQDPVIEDAEVDLDWSDNPDSQGTANGENNTDGNTIDTDGDSSGESDEGNVSEDGENQSQDAQTDKDVNNNDSNSSENGTSGNGVSPWFVIIPVAIVMIAAVVVVILRKKNKSLGE